MKYFEKEFFVIEAPRAGTAALWKYLSKHSSVSMPLNMRFSNRYHGNDKFFSLFSVHIK